MTNLNGNEVSGIIGANSPDWANNYGNIMKNKIVLNFWQALLLLLSIRAVYVLLYVIIGLLFNESYKTDAFLIFLEYVSILLYVPFIFWFAKKTGTNFNDSLFIPSLLTILKMLIIVLLARIIVLEPFDKSILFFESLTNAKLRIISTSTRPLFVYLDLRMILIVPIVEEFFFRGFVLKNFLKKYSPINAILLSSLLFSVHHLNFEKSIFYLLLGVLFGVLYYTTNSLIITSLAHIIWNVSTFFKYEFIELNSTITLLYLFIYTTSFALLVLLVRNSLIKVRRNMFINNINE